MKPLSRWSVRAINLPDHATNPIHTDAGGRAAGFDGALVAGVTTYAYLTHPAAASTADHWGLDWVRAGGAEVRLIAPVLDDDPIDCVPVAGNDGWSIEARVADDVRAAMTVWPSPDSGAVPVGPIRDGEQLDPADVPLDAHWIDYAERAGDDVRLYRNEGIIPPVAWVALANDIFHTQVVRGAWIHTRSRVQHLAVGRVGGTAHVATTIVERFTTRSGERAIADIAISVDGEPVARIEHEALISLRR